MILLNKDTTNKVIVTLSELVTLDPVYFLFEFISDDTKQAKMFIAEDISTNTCRYNEFDIVLTDSTEDLLNGVINLETNGYYKYNIYEQSSNTNLDPTLAGDLLERGKVYLKGDIKPVVTKYTNNDDNTYIAYQ